MKNKAAKDYQTKRNIPFCWDTFKKDPEFLK
jgi:hypothetical protein